VGAYLYIYSVCARVRACACKCACVRACVYVRACRCVHACECAREYMCAWVCLAARTVSPLFGCTETLRNKRHWPPLTVLSTKPIRVYSCLVGERLRRVQFLPRRRRSLSLRVRRLQPAGRLPAVSRSAAGQVGTGLASHRRQPRATPRETRLDAAIHTPTATHTHTPDTWTHTRTQAHTYRLINMYIKIDR